MRDRQGIEPPTTMKVSNAIQKLEQNKVTRVDDIPSVLLKDGGEEISNKLTDLMGKYWVQVEIPQEWKTAGIKPVNKKGDNAVCGSYRGTSLL